MNFNSTNDEPQVGNIKKTRSTDQTLITLRQSTNHRATAYYESMTINFSIQIFIQKAF